MLPQLLKILEQALHPDERDDAVIFGSSALVLQGVSLEREIDDLDVFVSTTLFEKIAERFPVQYKPGKDDGQIAYIKPPASNKIEFLKSFPGVDFEKVR